LRIASPYPGCVPAGNLSFGLQRIRPSRLKGIAFTQNHFYEAPLESLAALTPAYSARRATWGAAHDEVQQTMSTKHTRKDCRANGEGKLSQHSAQPLSTPFNPLNPGFRSVSALFFVCAVLAACSPVGSTVGAPTSVGRSTNDGDITRGGESSAGIPGTVDASDLYHSDTAGAESPENPLVPLVGQLSAQNGYANLTPEPVAGIYPVENQALTGSWGLLVVARSGAVSLLGADLRRGRTLFRLPHSPEFGAISPRGDRLALSFGDSIGLVDPLTGAMIDRFDRIKSRITALDWSPDGEALLVGAADGRIYRWRLDGAADELGSAEWNRRFERYIGHATTVSAVRYHPLGSLFFSGDWDGKVSAWRDYTADGASAEFERDALKAGFFTRATERMAAQGGVSREGIEALAIDREARHLIAAHQDGALELWGVRGLKMLGSRPPGGGAVYAMALSEDGKTVATASRDGRVRTYRVGVDSPGAPAFQPLGEAEHPGTRHLVFLRNGTLLAAEGSGRVVAVQ